MFKIDLQDMLILENKQFVFNSRNNNVKLVYFSKIAFRKRKMMC